MADVLALDVANYQGDINGLLDAHPEIGRVVVRCSLESEAHKAITRQQCATVRARGLGLDTYCWCYATWDDAASLAARSAALVGPWSPDYYWLDCEEVNTANKSWWTEARRNIAWLQGAVAGFEHAGLAVGIYTGHWFWTPAQWMANTTAFSHLPLWTATGTGVPDRSQGWEYGGWTHPFAGVQYDLSGPDRDCFDGALYTGGGDELSAAERAELEQYRKDQPYYDTLTQQILPSALGTMEAAAGAGKGTRAQLAHIVLGQCQAVRDATGITAMGGQ